MDPAFAFPGVQAEIFVPLQIDPAVAPRDGRNYSTVARLRPGVSLPLAQQDMEAIAAQTAREWPTYNTYWSATVVPLTEQAVGDIRRPLVILLGTVICVLLVACANIVNLSLMRATARAREMTVRLALGAGRGRLLQQLMTESRPGRDGRRARPPAGDGRRAGDRLDVSGDVPASPVRRNRVDWRVLSFTAMATISAAAALFGRARRERDLADEIRFHLEQATKLRTNAGQPREAAELDARRDFGSVALITEVTRARASNDVNVR